MARRDVSVARVLSATVLASSLIPGQGSCDSVPFHKGSEDTG